MVGKVGFEPTTYLTSRIYSPLASPFAYSPTRDHSLFLQWRRSLATSHEFFPLSRQQADTRSSARILITNKGNPQVGCSRPYLDHALCILFLHCHQTPNADFETMPPQRGLASYLSLK